MKAISRICLAILLVIISVTITEAQDGKKVLTIDNYPEWSTIVSSSLSDDGLWMSYGYRPNDGDDTLYLKNINSGDIYSDKYCDRPQFSSDSKWAVYRKNLSKKQQEKLRKSKKPVHSKGVLLNLETGEKIEWDKVSELAFSPNADYLIIKKQGAKNKHKGSDMLIKNLKFGQVRNIGNVSQFKFNKKGNFLAYIVDAEDKDGNGVYLMDLVSRSLSPLHTDTCLYSQLTWDDESLYRAEKNQKGTALAVLKGNDCDTLSFRENTLLMFTGLGTDNAWDRVYKHNSDFVISELGSMVFSLDNKSILLSLKKQEPVVKISKDSIANVDVWHWDDEIIQSVQMVRNSRIKRSTYKGIYHLDDKSFTQLTSDNMRNVFYNRNLDRIIGANPKPYISDTNWGGGQSEYYTIDPRSGEKTLIEKKIGRSMGLSPDGSYFLYFKEGDYFAYNMAAATITNISESVDVSFIDINEDHPYENPSYGVAGWSADKKSVLVNHLYDIWSVSLDGSGGRNITGNYGSENEIRLRINRTAYEPYLNLENDIYLSAYGEWTKKSGYFLLNDGKAPKELVYMDQSYGRLTKAYNADVYMFTRQTFVDFPDYYTAGPTLKKPAKQTNANPQQSDYKWGSSKLVDFENKKGEKLQAALILPADYEEGKKYPMIVYFYEKVSNRVYRYAAPRYDDRPHFSTYASNGYIILMPDIKYEEGKPGWNALDCVTSATQKVVDMGYADPERLAMQGHSWGGYQSSFILTQTDMFACVVTGAPVTNLTSMYNILYKNSGTNNHGIFELGQVRMGKGMFDDFQNYVDQSPVHNAPGISTPFMILHGTVDGAVDWSQGLEFYNAARRLGKNVILLSYPDENHHLAIKNNQIDFQKRMKQYFDYYLKDTEMPSWMKSGISYKDKLYNKAK